MNTKGFTLTELLVTVVILGVLVSIAMPQYMRAVERSRATEAMSIIKTVNDAIYVYYSDRERCPTLFSQLPVALPDADLEHASINSKFFTFTLGSASANSSNANTNVPGTSCPGVVAARRGVAKYDYVIWNPFSAGTSGKALALQCDGTTKDSIAVCESLGLYRSSAQE